MKRNECFMDYLGSLLFVLWAVQEYANLHSFTSSTMQWKVEQRKDLSSEMQVLLVSRAHDRPSLRLQTVESFTA